MKIENHKNPKNIYQNDKTENERKVKFFPFSQKLRAVINSQTPHSTI